MKTVTRIPNRETNNRRPQMSNMNMIYSEVDAPMASIVISPKQARKTFDEGALKELASNIRRNGLNNRGIARQLPNGKFELHAGERRFRALQINKTDFMPLRVFPSTVDDKRMRLIALSDNTERADLTTYETAAGMAALVEDFKMTGQEIANEMGHNVSYVNRLLKPFGELHPSIRKAWSENHPSATIVNLGKLVSKFAPEEQIIAWRNLCEYGAFDKPADADDSDVTDTDVDTNGSKEKDDKFRVKPALVLERYSIIWKGLKEIDPKLLTPEWVRAQMQYLIGKRQSPPTGIDTPEAAPKGKKPAPRTVRRTGSLEAE